MDNCFDVQTMRDFMKGKMFDVLYIKNIIGQKGLTSQSFFFKEKESSYVHTINVLGKRTSYKRIFDSKYKKGNEQIVVLKGFIINDVSLVKEDYNYSLKFKATIICDKTDTLSSMEFKLMDCSDGMYYECSKKNGHQLVNYFNKDSFFYDFLSLSKERIFNKEELFVSFDKFGTPMYTNDKAYDIKNKIYGLIKYHFIYKEYVFVTDKNEIHKLNDIKQNIVVFERKNKSRKNNDQFSNIISIFHYLVGEDEESIDYLRDLLDFLDEARLKEEIYSFIDKKIISGELVIECVDDFNVKLTYTYTS